MVRSLLTLRSDDLYPLPWDFGIVGTRTCFQSGDQRSDNQRPPQAVGLGHFLSNLRLVQITLFPQFRTLLS